MGQFMIYLMIVQGYRAVRNVVTVVTLCCNIFLFQQSLCFNLSNLSKRSQSPNSQVPSPKGPQGQRPKVSTWEGLARARRWSVGMVVPMVPDVLSHAVSEVADGTPVKATSSSVGLDDLLQHVRDHRLVPESVLGDCCGGEATE